jgi:glycosyltransferase involved in cell wall biosynthesis
MAMPNDLVSVVIPAFNGARFLVETLQSVFGQSRPVDEVIVVDDDSTDETRDLVRSQARCAPTPVRLIELARNSGGPAHPLNVGIDAARGEFIVPLDQDDLMTPDRVRRQVDFLEEHDDCPLVFGLYRVMHGNGPADTLDRVPTERILQVKHRRMGESQYLLDARDCYRRLIDDCNFVHGASNMAFRKSAWRRVGEINERFRVVWDYDLACRACTLGDIGFVGWVVQLHRIHGGNLSGPNLVAQRETTELRCSHMHRPWLNVDLSGARATVASLLLGLGYAEARHGNLLPAWRAYARGLRLGADWGRSLSGMMKAPPHFVLSSLLRRSFRRVGVRS